jgi:hypothetical protein
MLGGASLSPCMGAVPGPYVRRSVRRIVGPTLNCARVRTVLTTTQSDLQDLNHRGYTCTIRANR